MDEFDTKDPIQAREIAMQFMGQQMGEIKELNTRLVDSTVTLRPIDPKIRAVVDSIPLPPQGAPPPVPVQYIQNTSAAPPVVPIHPEFAPRAKNDNQLELNFTYDIVKDLVDRICRIEKLCRDITKKLEAGTVIIDTSQPTKKN
jgi:hypothetical protein